MSSFPTHPNSIGFVVILGAIVLVSMVNGVATAQNDFDPSPYPRQFRTVPTRVWSVTPPAIPDSALPGSTIDHSSMSPDSWSAPATPVALSPSNVGGSNSFEPSLGRQPNRSENEIQFDAAPSIPPMPTSQSVTQLAGDENQSAQKKWTEKGESPFRASGFSKNQTKQTDEFSSQAIEPALSNPLQDNMIPGRVTDVPPTERYPLGVNLQQVLPNASVIASGEPVLSNPALRPSNPLINNSGFVASSTAGTEMNQWHAAPMQTQAPVYQGQPMVPTPMTSMFGVTPNYRPDLGHRSPNPTIRNFGTWDNGDKFDFEDKKKEYPPFSEILATGRYFGSASVLYLQPSFQTNTAIATLGPTFGESIAFDFDYETAPELRLGFESKYGPGLELVYWQYDESANPVTFRSNGVVSGEVSTWMMGPSRWSRLTASNAGESLEANHSIDVESLGAYFFKEVQLPISRINGMFGFQYVSVAQSLDATLTQGATTIGRLNSRSDMRAYGPRFLFEYYRPVGHTKLEFITKFGGSVLFGERDQFVENTLAGDFSRVGADEFLTTTEFYSGLQVKKMVAEKRGFYGRIGFQYQVWHGGGTAVDAQSDFGLRGFAFGVGYNR